MPTIRGAHVHRWTDLDADRPMAALQRQRIIGENVMLSLVRLDKGCDVPVHAHQNEQLACVLEGRVTFRLGDDGDDEVTIGAGEVIHLPPNVPHGCIALESTLILDVFSPTSQTTGIDRA